MRCATVRPRNATEVLLSSSSFARHAYNEVVSFGAAWSQLLVYVVTVATSAFFVPHYLSIFWEPLKQNPWDIVGGIVVIVVLVSLNIVGVSEAAKLSVSLAVVDFITQVLLVILGFVLVLHPHVLTANIHWGVAPSWGRNCPVPVTLQPQFGAPIEFFLDECTVPSTVCALALITNNGGDLVVQREARYLVPARGVSPQRTIDQAYGWGMNWTPGRK